MSTIVQMSKQLANIRATAVLSDYSLRTFGEPGDIDAWLALRALAFADQSPSPGEWSRSAFQREFTEKWWWRPDWQWFVCDSTDASNVIGSITLALRGTVDRHTAVVHWLMVAPKHRGRGVAQWLLAALEQTAYSAGYRELRLETHSNWRSAVRFYESAGFVRSTQS